MTPILNYILCFALGSGFVLIFTKRKPLPSEGKHKKELNQLQTDKNQLELDKTNLQSRNSDLREIITQNQREIASNKREIRELKKTVGVLSSQVIMCLDLIGGITKIQNSNVDLNSEITIAQGLQKKYEQYYLSD